MKHCFLGVPCIQYHFSSAVNETCCQIQRSKVTALGEYGSTKPIFLRSKGDFLSVEFSEQIGNLLLTTEHIKTVSIKVSRDIGFLKHSKTFLPQETLKTLHTGIVEPHFRYCCSVWGCAGATGLNQL